MNNELQLVMIAGEQPFHSLAKRVNAPFAHWLNKQRERDGPIFSQRPLVTEVPSNRAFELIASLHNGPVRAKSAVRAADCAWSSHRAYVGSALAPRWLCVAEGLHRAGFDAPHGFDAAVNSLANKAAPLLAPPSKRSPRAPRVTPPIAAVIRVVAERFRITPEMLGRRHARGTISEAKQTAVHVARATGLPLAQIAEVLQVTRQRASRMAMAALDLESRARLEEIVRSLRDHCERDDT